MKKSITITLNEGEAWDLAQFFKRITITWDGEANCAADKAETQGMINVIEKARDQMADQGISPR